FSLDDAGAPDDRDQAPALATRDRTALRDGHRVTLARLASLVVCQQTRGTADVLAIALVLEHALDFHRDGLGRLGADHFALQRALCLFGCFRHVISLRSWRAVHPARS